MQYFTPILNLPQTPILPIPPLSQHLLIHNPNLKQLSPIPLTLTFHHQILHPPPPPQFLKLLPKYIQNPYLFILYIKPKQS
ncbi:2-oxo acid dehydrogenase subunit E2, partial [Staphylococcus warneri]|uniref:2-oxo acid dehydrogenase subunit E2 n=1 Tax=Staphylococcus warneri TaxID=1292 RepID=UPI0034D973F5